MVRNQCSKGQPMKRKANQPENTNSNSVNLTEMKRRKNELLPSNDRNVNKQKIE